MRCCVAKRSARPKLHVCAALVRSVQHRTSGSALCMNTNRTCVCLHGCSCTRLAKRFDATVSFCVDRGT
eukprot:5329523-Alexandrium_andersonii.AAC.1